MRSECPTQDEGAIEADTLVVVQIDEAERQGRVEALETQRQRIAPDPYHAGENLIEQIPTGEWVERAPYFEAVAVTGDGVFDTLKAVSKLVLKTLA